MIGTPTWANARPGWNTAPTKTSDLQAFVTAAARRYSGTYKGAGRRRSIGRVCEVDRLERAEQPGLPEAAVRPLGLEVGHAEPEGLRAGSATPSSRAVKSVHCSNKVACGVTSPRGQQPARDAAVVGLAARLPARDEARRREGLRRLRAPPVLRLSRRETPNTPPPPGKRGAPPTAVTLGNFELLTKELQRLYGNMRIWVTEYGYQTNPPDKLFGVTPAKQALYMQQAWDKLDANPKVDMMIWFLLKDEIAGRRRLAVRAVYTASGAKKPSRRDASSRPRDR